MKPYKAKKIATALAITIETLPKDSLTDYQTQGNLLALHKCHTPGIAHPHGELLYGSKDNAIITQKLKKLIKTWEDNDPPRSA